MNGENMFSFPNFWTRICYLPRGLVSQKQRQTRMKSDLDSGPEQLGPDINNAIKP